MATAPTPVGAGAGRPAGGRDVMAWLRTREGKVVAGAGAVLLVVVLALRKGAGTAAGAFSPQATSTDGTLAPLVDQVQGQGGTLSEWINATTGLAGNVESLTDLLRAQDPMDKPATPGALGKVSGVKWASNRQDITWTWSPLAGATKYLVELIQGGGANAQVIRSATVTKPGFQASPNAILGLRPGAHYGLRITPIGPGGAGQAIYSVGQTKA